MGWFLLLKKRWKFPNSNVLIILNSVPIVGRFGWKSMVVMKKPFVGNYLKMKRIISNNQRFLEDFNFNFRNLESFIMICKFNFLKQITMIYFIINLSFLEVISNIDKENTGNFMKCKGNVLTILQNMHILLKFKGNLLAIDQNN